MRAETAIESVVEVRVRDGREASVGENTWLLKPIAAAGNSVEQERRWRIAMRNGERTCPRLERKILEIQ